MEGVKGEQEVHCTCYYSVYQNLCVEHIRQMGMAHDICIFYLAWCRLL